ncbi:MAG: helix-turn-helix domain-containing protein [Planctomycetes bacterium]|nr:helix-turn-helix domain-containing protein [Planctomycetota bacterium]
MIERKDWSQVIRMVRARHGMTQEQFAAKLGVTFASVNRWENGRVTPSRLALRQIEDLLRGLDSDGCALLVEYFGGET